MLAMTAPTASMLGRNRSANRAELTNFEWAELIQAKAPAFLNFEDPVAPHGAPFHQFRRTGHLHERGDDAADVGAPTAHSRGSVRGVGPTAARRRTGRKKSAWPWPAVLSPASVRDFSLPLWSAVLYKRAVLALPWWHD